MLIRVLGHSVHILRATWEVCREVSIVKTFWARGLISRGVKINSIRGELVLMVCPMFCTCLFNLRPGIFTRTLSQMWGKLNLQILLFKVGLLTLIKTDSLMFLAKLYPSLPIIWKLLWLVRWPVSLLCWCIGEGCFRCSLYLSPKALEVSPIYSSQDRSPHWYQYITLLWLSKGSLSLRETRRLLIVFWNGFECHTYHTSFWYFHKNLVFKVWQISS